MDARIFATLISTAILFFVLDLIRRQKMTFKYSLAWLSACLMVFFFAFNYRLVFKISKLAGFQLPSNFIFFCLLVFFVFLTLLLTVYINEQNNRSESLAQSVGILEYRLKKLEKERGEQKLPGGRDQ